MRGLSVGDTVSVKIGMFKRPFEGKIVQVLNTDQYAIKVNPYTDPQVYHHSRVDLIERSTSKTDSISTKLSGGALVIELTPDQAGEFYSSLLNLKTCCEKSGILKERNMEAYSRLVKSLGVKE